MVKQYILAHFYLGIMLCEGYYTRRDSIKGVELLKKSDTLSNGFQNFGFRFLSKLGELYAAGLAQPGEDPLITDLEKAINYFDTAVKRFNPKKDDPNNRGFLQITKDQLENQKKRIVNMRPPSSGAEKKRDGKRLWK